MPNGMWGSRYEYEAEQRRAEAASGPAPDAPLDDAIQILRRQRAEAQAARMHAMRVESARLAVERDREAVARVEQGGEDG